MKKYNSIAIVGTQWGDEGKGKITNYFASRADYVVRYQGGGNAGHSIIYNNERFGLHLLPSGIFNTNVKNVLSNGVVIDLKGLLNEIEGLKKAGIVDISLFISDRAHIVFPYHKEIDALQEENRKSTIGTTKQGIGPAYTDKVARIGIRIIDLYDDDYLKEKLQENIEEKNRIFKAMKIDKKIDFEETYKFALEAREKIKHYVVDSSLLVFKALEKRKKVLFEGAQGILLCLDHGTYPFVTSSSPTSSSIPLNVGIPSYSISQTIGVTKAYVTRVGKGAFPTEFENEISKKIREVGKEYGTTTGRARRIGWFDVTLIKHAKRVSGLTGISITLLDVLTGIKELKIGINYTIGEHILESIPASERIYNDVKVNYVILPGWNENISKVKSFYDLPKNAKKYLEAIENYTGVPVVQFSVGPKKEQTINIENIW
ncbi:MAG: adenylosuccinate synthetase [Candidatus Hepatoplasma vulgare]|nr:MAG: adenylosuccinate synthetase [Candidatus Hepatoplasma sp.]